MQNFVLSLLGDISLSLGKHKIRDATGLQSVGVLNTYQYVEGLREVAEYNIIFNTCQNFCALPKCSVLYIHSWELVPLT